MEHTTRELNLLAQLLKFSDRYEISIQFWPEQTAVFISKGGVELVDYGGGFKHSIESALSYLKRINKQY